MIQITLPFRQHGVTCRYDSNRFKNAPRSKGTDGIYLPGEMEWEHQEVALRDGMRLPDYVIVNLRGLAEDVGMLPQLEV
jgi:LDH2 family malate/lactate/ureidoglycolate dehydrogenase